MATNAASIPAPGSDATERPKMVIPLREDLDLYPGPRTPEGAQTWTLYDAIRNRFFKMGWLEFEMLKRWKRGNVDAIAAGVSSETAMECRPVDVMALQAFLEQNQLVRRVGPGHVQPRALFWPRPFPGGRQSGRPARGAASRHQGATQRPWR